MSYPPEYHYLKVRRDGSEWLAIAVHQGDSIKVGGVTRREACDNLRRECWREHIAGHARLGRPRAEMILPIGESWLDPKP